MAALGVSAASSTVTVLLDRRHHRAKLNRMHLLLVMEFMSLVSWALRGLSRVGP